MVRRSKNTKKFFLEENGAFTLKPEAKSRVAKLNRGAYSITKALFWKKKQKLINEATKLFNSKDVDDTTIIELLDQEEKDLVDFVSKCIVLDPDQRITCEDALKHPFIVTHAKKRMTPWSTALLGSRGASTQDTAGDGALSAQAKPIVTDINEKDGKISI